MTENFRQSWLIAVKKYMKEYKIASFFKQVFHVLLRERHYVFKHELMLIMDSCVPFTSTIMTFYQSKSVTRHDSSIIVDRIAKCRKVFPLSIESESIS